MRLDSTVRLSDILELQGKPVNEASLKRLRRQIVAREREAGTKLITKPSQGAPYRTSLAALREHMPELFPPADPAPVHRLFRDVQEELDELRATNEQRKAELDEVRAQLVELRERDELLLRKFREIAP